MDAHQAQQSRWRAARALLSEASAALEANDPETAFAQYTRAHDLGDDLTACHVLAHLGRARIEWLRREVRAATLDGVFALLAVVVSPMRLLRKRRGRGFNPQDPKLRRG